MQVGKRGNRDGLRPAREGHRGLGASPRLRRNRHRRHRPRRLCAGLSPLAGGALRRRHGLPRTQRGEAPRAAGTGAGNGARDLRPHGLSGRGTAGPARPAAQRWPRRHRPLRPWPRLPQDRAPTARQARKAHRNRSWRLAPRLRGFRAGAGKAVGRTRWPRLDRQEHAASERFRRFLVLSRRDLHQPAPAAYAARFAARLRQLPSLHDRVPHERHRRAGASWMRGVAFRT